MNRNLLLLHGALGTKDQFKVLKEKLSIDFNVHSFDFEGHGAIASTNDFTMNLFVENAITYLRENEIEKTHVFGYSMGGYVALNVARQFPEVVDKVITLGTKFDWTKETAEKEIRMLNPDKIEEKIPEFAKTLAAIHSNNNWKEVVNKTAKMMYGLGAGSIVTKKDLEGITHEVLIAIGERDTMVSIDGSKETAGIIPNGRLKIVENFQHPIAKIDEDELKLILVDFIKN